MTGKRKLHPWVGLPPRKPLIEVGEVADRNLTPDELVIVNPFFTPRSRPLMPPPGNKYTDQQNAAWAAFARVNGASAAADGCTSPGLRAANGKDQPTGLRIARKNSRASMQPDAYGWSLEILMVAGRIEDTTTSSSVSSRQDSEEK